MVIDTKLIFKQFSHGKMTRMQYAVYEVKLSVTNCFCLQLNFVFILAIKNINSQRL